MDGVDLDDLLRQTAGGDAKAWSSLVGRFAGLVGLSGAVTGSVAQKPGTAPGRPGWRS
ncbi:MAG: hypothetical protein ABSB52_05895 [Acidimicrobiales bacterium]